MTLPDTFTLALYDASVLRECEVVWFASKFVGVRFTSKWHSAAKAEHGASHDAVVDVMRPSCEGDPEHKRHEL